MGLAPIRLAEGNKDFLDERKVLLSDEAIVSSFGKFVDLSAAQMTTSKIGRMSHHFPALGCYTSSKTSVML
jgi:hypothetical protein